MRRMLLWLAIGMVGAAAPAAAVNFIISNCTTQPKRFDVYNDWDGICALPSTYMTISPCQSDTLWCNANTCKVEGFSGEGTECWAHPKLNGHWVIRKDTSQRMPKTELDKLRGTPDWATYCACSEDRIPQ